MAIENSFMNDTLAVSQVSLVLELAISCIPLYQEVYVYCMYLYRAQTCIRHALCALPILGQQRTAAGPTTISMTLI